MLVDQNENEINTNKRQLIISNPGQERIEPVDPTLILPGDNNIVLLSQTLGLRNNIESGKADKKRLAIELFNEIARSENISEEEKEKYNILAQQINQNYLYAYGDISGNNANLEQNIAYIEENLEKPILINIPEVISYDVELTKLGKRCKGLKERHAIIKRGQLFSSEKPIDKLKETDYKKFKDKTEFLKGAELYIEELNEQVKSQGEWVYKEKPYRIRIDYVLKIEDNKPKKSSICLYFDDENKLKEVYVTLFGICLSDEKKQIITKNIGDCQKNFMGNRNYTILKILSVKNKIKKMKKIKNKIDQAIKGQIYGELDLNKFKIVKNPDYDPQPTILRQAKPPKLQTKEFSDFMPLISNISSKCGEQSNNKEEESARIKKKSLDDLIKKYESLKDEIPKEIINENNIELNDDGISFKIQKVQIQKNEEIKTFKLEPDIVDNAKYIYFDKNTPEIKFMAENNNENSNYNEGEIKNKNLDVDILSGDNIHEISNVILNSNIDINDSQDNNLVICGPKMDNNVGITYQYNNDGDSYIDPEDINIKSKIVNFYNKEQINGITLQILHSEIDINEHKLKDFYQNCTGSIIEDINVKNIKECLLFGYTIKLSDLKSIESPYIPPKDYKNHICFVEYNQQYFIPKEYMDKDIIIECFCIPIISFSKKENDIDEEKRGYISKLLSLYKIGYVKLNSKILKYGDNKYPIENNGIKESNDFILIQAGDDSFDNTKLKNIHGKDYSIGSDSYVEKIINKEFIDKAKRNKNISNEIKDKYFNVCFDNENNFILRPSEDMNINDFENDIKDNLINEPDPDSIIDKMKINQKYNYLPCCEKYLGEKTLSENKNLCFSEEQKNYIRNNYREGDWIYKIPEIKVSLLSKNLGCTKDSISQLNYSTDEQEDFPLKALNNNNDDEKIILINENNFNVIDKKELDNINNTDNFQWKTSIQFNNKLQMDSFLKLLILAKQNINTKEKNKNENLKTNDIDIEKMIDFDNKKKMDFDSDESGAAGGAGVNTKTKKCKLRVEFIDFINKMKLEYNPTYIRIYLLVKGNNYKSIFLSLETKDNNEDGNESFKNGLVENEKVKRMIDELNRNKGNDISFEFRKKIKIEKEKFNSGERNLNLGEKMITDVIIAKKLENFDIIIITSDKSQENTIEYKSTVDLPNSQTLCHKFELPIYKKDDKEDKIYGCIGIELYEKDLNFNEEYATLNSQYINEPLLILKEVINDENNKNIINKIQAIDYHFGLNEPNVFRRKILNFIHNKINACLDKNKNEVITNEILDNLYADLQKKCVKLPQRDLFSPFKFYNIIKNFDKDKNPYKEKLALKLLKIRRHEKFMKIFREKEWNLYFNNMNRGKLSVQQYIGDISDKKIYIENHKDPNRIRELIYLGIPQEYRVYLYNSFLETDQLYRKTRELLHDKNNINLDGEKQVFSYFADKTFEKDNTETNLVFSLIDNDSTFLWSLGNMSLEEIRTVKKIAKSFFIWAELGIGLDENDKYVYFIGLLSIIQKLKQIFEEDYIVFWILVGFSQYMDHFHQRNPLFTEDMNYINLYGLVCKLILERHQKEIYKKFISLNFPIEFFFSRHLSTLYTDYFNHELMMRILDILIFESSYKNINKDRLQGLRVLCAIPITLMGLNEKRILSCESVSEIESIFNGLALHTFNSNKFIVVLEYNFRKFFVCSNYLEMMGLNNQGREWDIKRDEMERLISEHFRPVYKENKKYLYEIYKINKSLNKNIGQMYKDYFENLKNKLKPVREVYYHHESYYDGGDANMETGVMVHVSKLHQIYNNDTKDIKEYKLVFSFGENVSRIGNFEKNEVELKFDKDNNKIENIQDLFFRESFEGYKFPKYIHFELIDKNSNNIIATFAYQILHYEPMKISKIVLENKEANRKYFLEIVIFKYTSKQLTSDDTELFNIIFDAPEYLHSKQIEEKLYDNSISNYYFNKELSKYINEENKIKNKLLNYNQLVQNMDSNYKLLNTYYIKEDEYNNQNWRQTNRIASQREKVVNYFIQDEIKDLVAKWLKETNISIEEILYSFVLIDKSLCTINQKLFLLYSIAQTKDKLLFSNDKLSLDKAKEIIYSLYKRFMIFFTKTDVERMIDYILKDERLFNIKYGFIYNKSNKNKINDFIFDKERYEPRLDPKKKKEYEICFDNIDKELNQYLNHLNNHYKMQSIPKDIIIHILSEIVKKKKTNFNQNEENPEFDNITLVIEKDNIIFRRNYTVQYKPFKITEDDDSNFNIQPKNDNNGLQIVDVQLCHEISNFETNNSYSVNNYISFDKFKEIFFKLPYLSDLFRVSFTYIEEYNDSINKEFDNFIVSIDYQDNLSIDDYKIKNSSIISLNINYGLFYFPSNENEININNNEENKGYNMKYKIKTSDTVDNILDKIIKFLEEEQNTKFKNLSNKEKFLIENLKSIDKINCYIYYYLNENAMEEKKGEKIGYFDRLNSCKELNDKHIAELKIIFNMDSFSYNSNNNLVTRKDGYCKIFYSNNNDYIWKKCKIKKNKISDVKLTSTDYKSKPLLNNDDVVFAFNI